MVPLALSSRATKTVHDKRVSLRVVEATKAAGFGQDALDNKTYLARGKLTMPVLAIGGEAAFGTMMAIVMRIAATDVQEAIVPDSGHSIMEENPSSTTQLVIDFLRSRG